MLNTIYISATIISLEKKRNYFSTRTALLKGFCAASELTVNCWFMLLLQRGSNIFGALDDQGQLLFMHPANPFTKCWNTNYRGDVTWAVRAVHVCFTLNMCGHDLTAGQWTVCPWPESTAWPGVQHAFRTDTRLDVCTLAFTSTAVAKTWTQRTNTITI